MKIPNAYGALARHHVSLARIVSEDSQPAKVHNIIETKSSKDS